VPEWGRMGQAGQWFSRVASVESETVHIAAGGLLSALPHTQ
jgi:hypothetical protein